MASIPIFNISDYLSVGKIKIKRERTFTGLSLLVWATLLSLLLDSQLATVETALRAYAVIKYR